jgi:hypothetical protein
MRRREFLMASAAAGTAAVVPFASPTTSFAGKVPGPYSYNTFSKDLSLPEPRPLEQVAAMTPLEIARSSGLITASYDELLRVAASLEVPAYRQLMTEILTKPRITFLDLYPTEQDRQKVFDEMVTRGFFNAEDAPGYVWPPDHDRIQTMLTAPQSHNDWYGSHPGGMALVVAFNIRIADAHTEHYRHRYGLPVNRDIPACALGIHEYFKAWFHAWLPDGSYGEEPRSLYNLTFHTHGVYVTAEMMHRRQDAALTMAVAAAHATGSIEPKIEGRYTRVALVGPNVVADIIAAASILAQVDPVAYGLLKRKNGKFELATLPTEQWVTHLGDMNWPYTMGVAHPVTHDLLLRMAVEDYRIPASDLKAFPYVRPFNQLKNYVWAQLGEIPLYEIIQREGSDAARTLVKRLVTT